MGCRSETQIQYFLRFKGYWKCQGVMLHVYYTMYLVFYRGYKCHTFLIIHTINRGYFTTLYLYHNPYIDIQALLK